MMLVITQRAARGVATAVSGSGSRVLPCSALGCCTLPWRLGFDADRRTFASSASPLSSASPVGAVVPLPSPCPPASAAYSAGADAVSGACGGSAGLPTLSPVASDSVSWAASMPSPVGGLTHDGPVFNPDAPYPIWFFDPEGPSYAFIFSVAKSFAGMLEHLQAFTGMPWWGTVVASSLLVRVVYFPVNCYSLRNASRFFDAKSDIQALQRSHRAALMSLGQAATSVEKFRLMRIYVGGAHAAMKKHKCYPWRTFATPFMMTPLFFASVLGARHLVMLGDESFETGGALWFTDLTVADPLFVLPALAATLSYAVLEVGFGASQTVRDSRGGTVSGAASLLQGGIVDKIKSGLQMFTIAGLPFVVELPAGILVGWIASSIWSILYIKAIRTPEAYRLITGREIPRRDDDGDGVFNIKITAPSAATPEGAEVSSLSSSDPSSLPSSDAGGSPDVGATAIGHAGQKASA